MPNRLRSILRNFLIWKYKHLSERQFVYILSVLVGLLAGLGTFPDIGKLIVRTLFV
ncbi:MAG: hypothetical protein QGH06_00860 [Lutibacter sp.]|nr:hypothetical protein [Lutibacter sp.]